MGLAASQARFLGITARKSNIEYEGQQVNQQRTALAEEVNALYSKLLALDVPVAPDTTEFYETDYSFDVSNTDGLDGSYLIKNYYRNDDGTYYLNTERTYDKNVAVGSVYSGSSVSKKEDGSFYFTSSDGVEHKLAQAGEGSNSMMAELINSTYGAGTIKDGEKFYYYQVEDGNDKGRPYYISESQLNASIQNPMQSLSTYYGTNKSVTESIVFTSAVLTFDDNNRISSIQDATTASGISLNINAEVGTTRVHNDDGYQAALRDYTMSKDEYDKMVADLNAQTETLQQEDKVLELRLDQIDTEQNELQTELEAVKAVLDKNIENTFKTFA